MGGAKIHELMSRMCRVGRQSEGIQLLPKPLIGTMEPATEASLSVLLSTLCLLDKEPFIQFLLL